MTNGYMGKMLRINLNTAESWDEELPEPMLRTWIGGIGLGIQYLFKEVPPQVSWDDPENRVIIASGPLGGTRVTGSGTFAICTKGAMTGGAASSQANGFLGAYLKFCGYDGLIIQGAAPEWVYLYIDDKGVSLRSAVHLAGVNTWELQDVLRKELGSDRVSIHGIGPAGENRVRFACLVGDYGHVAAHNGVGAVLGSKKLKAIVVVRGNKTVPIHDKSQLAEISKAMSEEAKTVGIGPATIAWGTNSAFMMIPKMGILPIKNLTTSFFPESEKFSGQYLRSNFEVKPETCWACSWAHCRRIKINDGPYAGFEGEEPEYEAMAAMGPVIGQKDPAAAVVLANLIDRLGLDANESGWVIGWVMECYEKGYLKKEDLDGLEMTWGNASGTHSLLEKIAYRQGVGRMLAEGVKRAAEKIGGEALSCAVYTLKGNTPRGHDHRAAWTELFDTCLSNTGTIESTGGFLRSQQHGLEPISNPFDWEQVINQNAKTNGRRIFEDSLGICRFPNENISTMVSCVNAATGWNLTLSEAMIIGKRIVNLMRIFNFRCGITNDKDAPSARYGSTPVDGPAQGISTRDIWDKATRRYYELMGWDPETGYPLPATLKALGLENLINQ
jgi:aldehyde:ferredoxin oxidoreductase